MSPRTLIFAEAPTADRLEVLVQDIEEALARLALHPDAVVGDVSPWLLALSRHDPMQGAASPRLRARAATLRTRLLLLGAQPDEAAVEDVFERLSARLRGGGGPGSRWQEAALSEAFLDAPRQLGHWRLAALAASVLLVCAVVLPSMQSSRSYEAAAPRGVDGPQGQDPRHELLAPLAGAPSRRRLARDAHRVGPGRGLAHILGQRRSPRAAPAAAPLPAACPAPGSDPGHRPGRQRCHAESPAAGSGGA